MGNSFHFTVALEAFGGIQNREVSGKIVGDTLVLTPAMPGPPPGMGPGEPDGGMLKPQNGLNGAPASSAR